MYSILVNRNDNSEHCGRLDIIQHTRRKSRATCFLERMVIIMRDLPYQIIAVVFLFGAMMTGALLQSGAAYIKEQAYVRGQISAINSLDIRELSSINVRDL